MSIFRQIVAMLLGSAIMCSCGEWFEKKDDIITYGTVGEYITINRNNTQIDVFNTPSYKVLAVETENNKATIKLSIRYRDITNIVAHALGEDDGIYQECIERFGDYNPNPVTVGFSMSAGGWYVESNPTMILAYPCAYEIIHAIEIKSSADWDAEHPAGDSLNDLFTIDFESLYPYIKQGWIDYPTFTHISKPLSQLEEEDLMLLKINSTLYVNNPDILLISEKLPTTAGTHTIFVTLTLDTGEKIEYSTDYTFE